MSSHPVSADDGRDWSKEEAGVQGAAAGLVGPVSASAAELCHRAVETGVSSPGRCLCEPCISDSSVILLSGNSHC